MQLFFNSLRIFGFVLGIQSDVVVGLTNELLGDDVERGLYFSVDAMAQYTVIMIKGMRDDGTMCW